MKKVLRRCLCAALASVMMLSVSTTALSYTGIGEVINIKRDKIGDGLRYSEIASVTENGRNQRSYIFEYDPAGGVLPLVRCGGGVYGTQKLGSIVSSASEEGNTVLGALNGDFYSLQTGIPLGVMIDGGELVSSDDAKYAFALTDDGKVMISKPELSLSLTNMTDGKTVSIDHFNKYPSVWGAYLLDGSFSSTTHSTLASTEIVIETDGAFKPGGSVKGTVREVIKGKMNNAVPEGCAVLVIAESCARHGEFTAIKAGDELTIDIACAEGWDRVVTALGGGDLILEGGSMPDGIIDESHEKTANPRTAVGIKEDGTAVFFAADGRTSASYGLTEAELSALMSELGCVSALNLDGGGSTTVMVKASDKKDCVYVNIPSDESYRAVSNGILFISAHESDGTAAALSVSPNTPYVLSGSTVSFRASVLDKAYIPTEVFIDTDELTAEFAAEYGENAGSVSGGSYTAGTELGEFVINVSSGDLEGEVNVIVTDRIDSLNVTPSYVKAKSGTLVKLEVGAGMNGKSIVCDAGSLHYTLNGTHNIADQKSYPGAMILCDLGYIDFDGNFQSFGGREGKVEVGIEYGDIKRTVVINIGTGPDIISEFEELSDYSNFMLGTSSGSIYLMPGVSGFASDHALGLGSVTKNADAANTAALSLRDGFPVAPGAKGIKLWIHGDISEAITAGLRDDSGKLHSLSYSVTTDYSKQNGWRELTAAIPEALADSSLYIEDLLVMKAAGTTEHRLIIDGAYVCYGDKADVTVTDIEEHWAKDSIYALYSMGVIRNEDLISKNDLLYYTPDSQLTRGEFAKMLALWTGLDSSGFTNSGAKLEKNTPEDKLRYIRAVLDAGLMSGRGTDSDGTVIFDADATITREETCKVIGSLIDANPSQLDFSDAADISDWARDGIAECVSAGIIGGYDDGTVRPKATITRAEFAAVLSRIG